MERKAREARKNSSVRCVPLRSLRALRSNVVFIGYDSARTGRLRSLGQPQTPANLGNGKIVTGREVSVFNFSEHGVNGAQIVSLQRYPVVHRVFEVRLDDSIGGFFSHATDDPQLTHDVPELQRTVLALLPFRRGAGSHFVERAAVQHHREADERFDNPWDVGVDAAVHVDDFR